MEETKRHRYTKMLGKVIGIYENRPLSPWKIVIISALKEYLHSFDKDLFSRRYTFQNHLTEENYHGNKKNPYARR